MLKKSSFALVIPCYNEEKVIPFFAAELTLFKQQFAEKFANWTFSVIVVNNNSTDQSDQLLNLHLAAFDFVKVIHCSDQGYGAALKCGFSVVTADFYAFADLDNTYPLNDLIPMLSLSLEKNFDMILGGRLNTQSKIPLIRKLGNLFYSGLAKLIFNGPIQDTCSGMRIFNRHKLNDVLNLKQDDLSFSIELTAHAFKNKWSLDEYPIHYRDRLGLSKLAVHKDGIKFLYILLIKRLFT